MNALSGMTQLNTFSAGAKDLAPTPRPASNPAPARAESRPSRDNSSSSKSNDKAFDKVLEEKSERAEDKAENKKRNPLLTTNSKKNQQQQSPQQQSASRNDIGVRSQQGERSLPIEKPIDEDFSLAPIPGENQFAPIQSSVAAQQTLEDNSPDALISSLSERIDQLGMKAHQVVDPLSRRVAILDFMKKMNTEFGVKPMDLVQAFSKLSTEELGMPASHTVSHVVDQLPLQPEENLRAKQYFTEMMNRAEASSIADYLKASDRQLSLEVMSRRDLQKQKMDASIDKMQNQFFSQTQAKEGEDSGVKPVIIPGMAAQTGKMAAQKAPVLPATVLPQAADAVPVASAPVEAAPMQAPQPSFDDLMGKLTLAMKGVESATNGMATASAGAATNPVPTMSVEGGSTEAMAEGASDMASVMGLATGDSDGDAAMDGEGQPDMYQLAAQKSDAPKAQKTAQPFNVNTKIEPTATEDAENVNQILTKAQTLIKKGGGEMKVKMTPEGMGELSLKVAVENGKVNVDMLTENNHIKKMVEKGLGELKATLASHKLDVEAIKVDVGNDTNNDMNKEQEDAERRFQQQFLQDFRRGNQQFKEAYGFGRIGKIGSQLGGDDAQDPEADLRLRKKNQSSRRLDLVA